MPVLKNIGTTLSCGSLVNPDKNNWSVDHARDLYGIERWGAGYFNINSAGRVVAQPLQEVGGRVELTEVV
ncbi:uncharacterized protein METZ01_LOCUS264599, partial [marine metagenome]